MWEAIKDFLGALVGFITAKRQQQADQDEEEGRKLLEQTEKEAHGG